MKYRPVEGIMDRQARGYTDEQLRLISDYLSTQPGTGGDYSGGKYNEYPEQKAVPQTGQCDDSPGRSPPCSRRGNNSSRVVVVGGGFGGATLAKYVRMWGGNVEVTLVDANPNHVSCILSNLVVTGALPMSRITLGFDSLKANHGVTVMQGRAVAIDAPATR